MAAPNQPGRKPSPRPGGNVPQGSSPGARPAPRQAPQPAARPAPRPAPQRSAAPAPAPAQRRAPPPNPQPAGQPRGAAVDEAPRRSWFRRLVRLGVVALVLLLAVLVTRSVIVDGTPDLTTEDGWVNFVRSMFRSGRDLRDRSKNLVAQLKEEMGGVESWLKDRKIELPATDDLLKKADEMLNSAREKVDTAMAPPVPTYTAPPQPKPEPGPTQIAAVTPKPVAPPAVTPAPPPPAVPVVPALKPEPAPVTVPAPTPRPTPVTTPQTVPTPKPLTGPVGTPPSTPTVPAPPPPPPVATPNPVPVTAPAPGPRVTPAPAPRTEPVIVVPLEPVGPATTSAPTPAAPPPPAPPANPDFAEAQSVFHEGLEHYRKTRHGAPDMQQELRESARLFRKAQGLLETAAKREPRNGEIEKTQVEVNRFLYDSLKRQTL